MTADPQHASEGAASDPSRDESRQHEQHETRQDESWRDESRRKGWCPGALRPMAARDGLLVRLRLTGGRLSADQARAIASLAVFYGNGLFDLSARANLQLRGVTASALPSLQDALADLGLLDTDPQAESVRNVLASPLAGLGADIDVGPIVDQLEARLVAEPALHGLPPKFGFLVDDGSVPSLAGIAADVRFDLLPDRPGGRVWIGLGGTRDHAVALGFCRPDEIVEAAAWIATRFLALAAAGAPVRRMAALVDRMGAYPLLRALGCQSEVARPEYSGAILQRPPVGLHREGPTPFLGLAVPFGRLDHAMLRAAADVAEARGRGALRLTPWRCLLLPDVVEIGDPEPLRAQGFILDPDAPRLRVAACVGAPGCANGTTATHADAESLADLAALFAGSSLSLHLSGCDKGCAKASRTPVTLVGREGRYDLVVHGRPSDPPTGRDLDLAGARAAILALKRDAATKEPA